MHCIFKLSAVTIQRRSPAFTFQKPFIKYLWNIFVRRMQKQNPACSQILRIKTSSKKNFFVLFSGFSHQAVLTRLSAYALENNFVDSIDGHPVYVVSWRTSWCVIWISTSLLTEGLRDQREDSLSKHRFISNVKGSKRYLEKKMDSSNSSLRNSSKIREVKEFQMGSVINLYYPPVFILVGSTGNFLMYIVYRLKSLKKKPLPLFMRWLAVTDNILLLGISLTRWMHTNFTYRITSQRHNKGICIAFTFLGHFFMNWSHFLVVAVTLTRLIAVALPLTPKISAEKARRYSLGIGMFSVVKNLHFIWWTDFEYDNEEQLLFCGMQHNHTTLLDVLIQWVETIVSCITPFLVILTANVCIIRKLQKKRRSTTQKALFLCLPRKVRSMRQRQESYMTMVALVVSFVFLLLVSPLSVYYLYQVHAGNDHDDVHARAFLFLAYNLCLNLRYTNSAVNFYMYALIGRDCQKGLRRLLKMKRTIRPYTSDVYRAGGISNTPSVSSAISPYLITTTF